MGLRKRPIDPFRLVSVHDDALDAIPDKVLREWQDADRDMAVLEQRIAKLENKPVVFICEPLQAQYDGIAVSGSIADLKLIFAVHVHDIQNAPSDMQPKWIQVDDRQRLDLDYVNTFPLGWVTDIAGTIIARGIGSDMSPFTLPDTFWRGRTRRAVRLHAAALAASVPTTETASGENSSNV